MRSTSLFLLGVAALVVFTVVLLAGRVVAELQTVGGAL